MSGLLTSQHRRWLWLALLSVLGVRLLSLGTYSLQDTTEARYAEISRIMLETQNWVTPQFDYGIPFWGKPPLATWLSAGSFQLFGVNEFAARFPSLILAIIILVAVYTLAKRQRDSDFALIACYILASGILFFIAAGAVIMDTALVTGISLAMISFWLAMKTEKQKWGYLFFIGLSVGLLSKGPLTFVLVGFPIFLWMLWQRNFLQVWQRIPWLSGGILMLAISLPWYILAELRTPGFIDYFIVGEHWKRFTVTGWQGDLYGSAHAKMRGTIWLYAVLAFLPWSLFLPLLLRKKFKLVKKVIANDKSWLVYLGLWAVTPILFFSFAGNILATYALPAMIPLSILAAEIFSLSFVSKGEYDGRYKSPSTKSFQWLFYTGILVPILIVVAITLQNKNQIPEKSQKELLIAYQKEKIATDSQLIYLIKRPFSAQYYSQGKAIETKTWGKISPYLEDEKRDYFVVKNRELKNMPDNIKKVLTNTGEYNGYYLFIENEK
ncbi:Polymyxin resistance protein ArnT, undecaprenyl phosphate-alpha-L-Ara4N transferase; Melittin resistance protein PqaB [hydrothermal vent metagenome]|uniref:Polymyxin resistance protein ArnT, undecaprenyl phosphate-alpha-L-Ara4N transferase Melittin resistance protein PqaB n=1 Tax=hydrothermal vent metagenome TaxID=652676 RepID=A0A3B0XEK9_9ZZZZ